MMRTSVLEIIGYKVTVITSSIPNILRSHFQLLLGTVHSSRFLALLGNQHDDDKTILARCAQRGAPDGLCILAKQHFRHVHLLRLRVQHANLRAQPTLQPTALGRSPCGPTKSCSERTIPSRRANWPR